jgi:hypothetical protein
MASSDQHPPDVLSEHANIPSHMQLKQILIPGAANRKCSRAYGHSMCSDNSKNNLMILQKHSEPLSK